METSGTASSRLENRQSMERSLKGGLAPGESLTTIGKLLGHTQMHTTAGYTHLADAHLVEAAEKVGALVATAMTSQRPRPITHRR